MASLNTPIHVDDGFNEYECVSKCQKFTTSKSSGTFHLRRHLNSCLKKFIKDITQFTITTQPSLGVGSSIKTYKFDVDEYMMSIASPNFKNISRQPAIRDVLMYYAKERDHAKKDTAHWVYKDRKLQKKIIRFIDLSPPYDVRCCAHILNLIVKAGLELVDDVVGKI
ncbi:hypothetical protein Gotri_000714 [Gossypium trilobum]|uniref:Uncharacterized protein n=1 Tax=Gossypium trilobum TaxID=34281 RepID=A0A7J9FD61_9ROSI|nr:hypothetical protein [Gossypium trilobum]